MSVNGSTAMEFALSEEPASLFRADQKWPAVAPVTNTARSNTIATLWRGSLGDKDLACSKAAVSGAPVPPCVSEVGLGAAVSSTTVAINLYPRLVTVSINSGLPGRSPKIFRMSRMYFLTTSGFTYVSGHSFSRSSSGVTSRPGFSTRYRRTS